MRLNDGTRWSMELVTAPTKQPLEINQVRDDHLRVISDDTEAEYIQGLIRTATDHAESFTRTKLLTQTWRIYLDRFPKHFIELPYPPLQSVSSVKYLDTAGTLTTWAASNYKISPPATSGATTPRAKRARIYREYGVSWPSVRDVVDAVQVEFVCGYGDDGKDVPDPILHGMKMIAAEMYTQRKESLQDVFQHEAIVGAENLWWRHRLH